MKLILPEQITETLYLDYLADWGDEKIVPFASSAQGLSFEDWRQKNIRMRTSVPEYLVTSTLYFLTDNAQTKLCGAIDIRHRLNDHLVQFGGHIGYGIVPSERGKGYAKAQLRLALPIAKSLGVTRALVTCGDTNIGSARTIESCGGVLENKVADGGELTRRYWIEL